MWDDGVPLDRLIKPVEMICWAAKWIGEPDSSIVFYSVKHDGKKKMVKEAWKMLDEADVVLHFNGRRFDVPHLQREFLEAGLLPPSPYQQIDLYETIKRQFRFTSSKLAHVTQQLGLVGKEKHAGFSLWVKCMEGDEAAWKKMKSYNIQDVVLLEQLYGIVRPWIRSHPSFGANVGEDVCPKCGGKELTSRGFTVLRSGRYRRFQCKSCGGWSRSTKRHDRTQVVETA